MPSDYAAIRAENERRYGTDIGRIGQMLLADRYDDRTHFIFELLQNAEDALARRKGWTGSRAVRFNLQQNALYFSHYGKLFDDLDVRGICGIAESTKDKTAIGRFGIGFKSVYAYTKRPEVHSGDESFAIESFVWPTPTRSLQRHSDETIIALPLNAGVQSAQQEIAQGLQCLGPTALLFLRQIEEIEWTVADGLPGMYMRSKPEPVAPGVHKISLIGQQADAKEIEESWLIFYRDVATDDGTVVGQVEVAFSIADGANSNKWSITRVSNSPLVVYFPTVVPTHLGFLIQGPYRTTPSRDNVAKNDPWNQHLVQETCSMLVESLHALRDMHLLSTDALRVLPLDRARFSDGQMFAPVFEAVRIALRSERLLPSADNGHVAAFRARLARTQELRALFTPQQLAHVLGEGEEVAWLSGDITQDRTPDLRQYLMQELGVSEVTPETILPRIAKPFLEAQSDDWIIRLYEFLNERPALHRRVEDIPLIRLTDGTHLKAKDGSGKPQAFLPSDIETGFPTVKASVCQAGAATEFLRSLGLREPDPVDDVILNVLPKYKQNSVRVSDQVYAADLQRITTAFRSDSTSQRSRLIDVLRQSYVVKAVDGGGAKVMAKPGAVYVATERLRALFDGVPGVLLVDDSHECLRGESIRDLLVASGTSRYLRPIAVQTNYTWQEREEMRRAAGCVDCTYDIELKDGTLAGIENVLSIISTADQSTAADKARMLWEALADVEDRSGIGAFTGTYSWMYYQTRTHRFDAAFVRRLNTSAWVPAADGALHRPDEVIFDSLGWKSDPGLQSKILFKPPIIEQLAKEAGIDPAILDLLKRLGVTSLEELSRRLGVASGPEADPAAEDPPDGGNEPSNDEFDKENSHGASEGKDAENSECRGDSGGRSHDGDHNRKRGDGDGGCGERRRGASQGGSNPNSKNRDGKAEPSGSRPFISYIGTHREDSEDAPDGLSHDERMALEAMAIEIILEIEPELERTHANNPGFDLVEAGVHGRPIRWVEVKAMTGSLDDRPVCMSRTQFDCAWIKGEAYWLYIVECANDRENARVLRISDPAGKARNFTFDSGWRLAADPIRRRVHPPSG